MPNNPNPGERNRNKNLKKKFEEEAKKKRKAKGSQGLKFLDGQRELWPDTSSIVDPWRIVFDVENDEVAQQRIFFFKDHQQLLAKLKDLGASNMRHLLSNTKILQLSRIDEDDEDGSVKLAKRMIQLF